MSISVLLIGERGSGKSSLMASITQIPFPTAEGVTNDRCQVRVRLKRDREELLPIYRVSIINPNDGTRQIGETRDKNELQEIIRNTYSLAAVDEIPISRDMIDIEVLGAKVDAEFIELPGLNSVPYFLSAADKIE